MKELREKTNRSTALQDFNRLSCCHMQESFLHFIWLHQYFNKHSLISTAGDTLTVLHPGIYNTNSGPDFNHARILRNNIEWAGMVEIHIRSADWYRHGHHRDPSYQEVILHVVWQDDQPVLDQNGYKIPTLILKGRVSPDLILKHRRLQTTKLQIPCHSQVSTDHFSQLHTMLDRVLIKRLVQKRDNVLKVLAQCHGHWDLVYYRFLGRNFGFKINSEPFEELTRITPLPVVRKLYSCFQLEALFFGQAGMLNRNLSDRYYRALQKEFTYLKKKFTSLPSNRLASRWKFLRMRPANFPTLRIAQFAAFIHHNGLRFAHFRDMNRWIQLEEFLSFPVSDYWKTHYHFSSIATAKNPGLGKDSKLFIAINSLVPLRMAYQYHFNKSQSNDEALSLLKSIPAEKNKLINSWNEVGFKSMSGFHTQALLALNKQYCSTKKCLNCALGKSLLTET